MELLLPIAAKSFLVAGAALLLLGLASKRSASQRSWIAHLGLAALLLLPVAAVALPSINVEAPGFLSAPAEEVTATTKVSDTLVDKEAASSAAYFPQSAAAAVEPAAPRDWVVWAYAAPAALLLLLTLIALGRLFSLRARADVLVEPHWLTALARAQQRMRFKHGTALLTSDDLPSPISWGVMRPVILLNREAAKSHAEAEAIIAHELAHVASLDWAKLLLSRIAVAIFWFNPLVWLLAREAHQLREEAADDAVLGADIADTDYAQLLVGVARHECRGILIGAHGVAPARNSLARRVRRVLDAGSVRGPVGRAFALGMFAGATMLAAPLAALSLKPSEPVDTSKPYYAGAHPEVQSPALAATIAEAATAAAETAAVAAIPPAVASAAAEKAGEVIAASGSKVVENDGRTVITSPDGASVTMFPPDARGRRKMVLRGPNGAVMTLPDAAAVPGFAPPAVPHRSSRDVADIVAAKTSGVTSDYAAAMRAASPALRHLDADDMAGMKAVGVTPGYVRELASLGYHRLDEDELTGARAVGVTGEYVRSLQAAGLRGVSIDELTQLRAVGVTPNDVRQFRRAGHGTARPEKVVRWKTGGLHEDPDPDPHPDDEHDPG